MAGRPRQERPEGGAPVRRQGAGRRHQRLTRTIVLAAVAVIAGIAWLARELDLDVGALLDYALASLLLVVGVVLLAVVGAAAMRALKRLFR
ncbi:MAG: hypothetical protein ACODAC_12420 [Pseudomonadota bacterium]